MSSNHLHRRNGVYYYHRRVPKPFQRHFGKVIKFSLATQSLAQAKSARTRFDIIWDCKFDSATPDSSGAPLTEAEIETRVREHLDTTFKLTSKRLADAPPTVSERNDLLIETDQRLSWLRHPDEAQGAEMIARGFELVFKGSDNDLLASRAVQVLRRGLEEFERRKLAMLEAGYPPDRSFDPLFDPRKKRRETFGDLVAQYVAKRALEDPANGLRKKTQDKWGAHVALVSDLVGAETPLHEIDYDRCFQLRSALSKVPANFRKRHPAANIHQAIDEGEKAGRPTLSLVTQGDYWRVLCALLAFAADKQLIQINPAARIKPLGAETKRSDEKRSAFSNDQLIQFFGSTFYCQVAKSGGANLPLTRRWRFWMPLISVFHGLRAREIAQLLVGDVKSTLDGTWYFDITDRGAGAESKSLKNPASRRRVPVHPECIKIGLLDYVRSRQEQESTELLLAPLIRDSYGDPAAYPLRRFNEKFLHEELCRRKDQSFHSFRHNFRDALRRVSAPPEVMRIAGWTVTRSVSDDYGSEQDNPDLMAEWIGKVNYPGLTLAHLYERGSAL